MDSGILHDLFFIIMGLIFIPLSMLVKGFLVPYNIKEQLTQHRNLAVAISNTGYLFGVVIVLFGAYLGPAKGFQEDLINFALYGSLGIILLNVARIANDKILFRKFISSDEIVRDKNIGAGAVEAGSYIASAMIVAGSIYGEGGGAYSAVAFFVMGQLVLLLASVIYNAITPFDIHHEIEQDNAAAGVAFSGTLIGTGVILLKGIAGNFTTWQTALTDFGLSVAISLVAFPLMRFILDKILLAGVNFNEAIEKDKNIAVAFIEMSLAVSVSVFIYFMLNFTT